MSWKVFGGVAAALFVATGIAIWIGARPAPAPVQKPVAAMPSPPATAQIAAVIRALHTIAVPSPSGGNIDAFYADVNQEVAEGQLLARVGASSVESAMEIAAHEVAVTKTRITELDGRLISERLEASRSRTDANRASLELDRLDKAYKRQAYLNAQGATARLTYQKAAKDFEAHQSLAKAMGDLANQVEASVAALTGEIDAAKRLLADKEKQTEEAEAAVLASEIHAPATGTIVARKGEVGKAIAPNERDQLFQIAVDLNQLMAAFPAPADMKGKMATLVCPDVQMPALTMPVTEIRANEANLYIVNAIPGLRPGMTCMVSVPLK